MRVVTLACCCLILVVPEAAYPYAGISSTEGCADLVDTPQRFWRHRDGDLTYRISNNFKNRYPDDFSQYLVDDVVRWWEDYINVGLQWRIDIEERFSYLRQDPDSGVYELKSVLNHEFGHAMGMQHSDACFYNTNNATNMPWQANHRTGPGGVAFVQATLGPELMNEIWTESSPGQKAPMSLGVDGYNRTPGQDDWEFINYAYPFQSISFDRIEAGMETVLFDSTDIGTSGGQTSYPGGVTPIDADDLDQGWFLDRVNVWVGNSIGIRSRAETWQVENTTGSDITQVTFRVDGTSTRRAISESAPGVFANFGAGTTSSPEQLIFDWSASLANPWPAGSTGWFSLQLDVHDWTVAEALLWHGSNDAWPIPLPGLLPVGPWGLTTPSTPPPGRELGFTAGTDLPPEPTPEPDDIELLPPTERRPASRSRGVTLVLPAVPGTVLERVDILPLSWAAAELYARDGGERRVAGLSQAFRANAKKVRPLLASKPTAEGGYDLETLGFRPQESPARDGETGLVASTLEIPLGDEQTYAARVTASTGDVRVTLLALPEMTEYFGTRAARCDLSDDASSCCPYGVPVVEGTESRDHRLMAKETRCWLGKSGDDKVRIDGANPQFVATGAGDDRVRASGSAATVSLGGGDDRLKAAKSSPVSVSGGSGADRIDTSASADHVEGGAGADVIRTFDGDDVVYAGAGGDRVEGGAGNDRIFPGSGADRIDAGSGDDLVVLLHPCELRAQKRLSGGPGHDILSLPVTVEEARRGGLVFSGFETVLENAGRSSRFADCEP